MKREWKWFETMFRDLADMLNDFLRKENITFERSGCYGFYHYEIFCNRAEEEKIEKWLAENTIHE